MTRTVCRQNTPQSRPLRLSHRVRQAVNLVNGSTLAGLAVARIGSARLARCPDGLLTGTRYQLPVPPAPAFTLGNVIITRRPSLDVDSALFRHEARHATQYFCCGGLLMLPLYFASAGASWLVSGDFGAWNPFERAAGLVDGGYTPRPIRRLTLTPHRSACADTPTPAFLAVIRHARSLRRYWVSLAAVFAGKDTQSSDGCAAGSMISGRHRKAAG